VTVPSAFWLPLFLFLLAAMEFNFFWNVFAISAEVLSIAGCYLQATMFEICHVHNSQQKACSKLEGMFTVHNRRIFTVHKIKISNSTKLEGMLKTNP
jgi:hypothetical protein